MSVSSFLNTSKVLGMSAVFGSSSESQCMALVPCQAPVLRQAVDTYGQRAQMETRVDTFVARNKVLLPVHNFTDVCREPTVNARMQDVKTATGLPKSIVALAVAYEELPVSMTMDQFTMANHMTNMWFKLYMQLGQVTSQKVMDELAIPENETRIVVAALTPRARGTLRQLAQMLQRVASADFERMGFVLTPARNRAIEISAMRVMFPLTTNFIAITDQVTTTFADSASQEHLSTPFPEPLS